MASVYTRKGDSGKTGLASGRRVSKSHVRVHLYGLVDELNCQIGAAVAQVAGESSKSSRQEQSRQLQQELQAQQRLLFELGSELAGLQASTDSSTTGSSVIREQDIASLEESMDRIEAEVGRLKTFILPGGTPEAASLHVARTVCRRLEREMAAALENKGKDETGKLLINKLSFIYINRLSDWLFMAARYSNFLSNVPDIPWSKRPEDDRK